jgi:hypothetical protein
MSSTETEELEEEVVTYSGDTRVVKHLLFPYFIEGESAMQPGLMVFYEKIAKRGEEIDISELREADLEKGERLGSFFNDDEMRQIARAGVEGNLEAAGVGFDASEAGEHEIAEYITENRLTVDETVALSGGDPVVAQRVLEAESVASGGDSRKGVVAGLEAVIASND